MLTFTTSRLLMVFLTPWCIGYWHGRRCFQNFPKEWRCFGQIIISLTLGSGSSKPPALVRISSNSVILSLDKWQVFKWVVIESLHSPRRKSPVIPRALESTQPPLYLELCDKKHDIALFTNFLTALFLLRYLTTQSAAKFDWHVPNDSNALSTL